MNYLKKNYLNLIFLVLGILIMAFGGSIIITAGKGGDSVTVFSQGIAALFNIEYGYGNIIGNVIFLTFMIIFHRKSIGVGTVLTTVTIGLILNFYFKVLPYEYLENSNYKFLFSLAGLVVAAFGLTLYIYSNTGLASFEAFIDYFSLKFNIRFGYVKIVVDAILFGLGALMGGVFGITSIISVIIMGPLIEFFKFLFNKTNLIKIEPPEITEKSP